MTDTMKLLVEIAPILIGMLSIMFIIGLVIGVIIGKAMGAIRSYNEGMKVGLTVRHQKERGVDPAKAVPSPDALIKDKGSIGLEKPEHLRIRA